MPDLHREKWDTFLKRAAIFQFIPFIDFVFASGSLVTGNLKRNSDFDVLIGTEKNRIFTVRAFCIVLFGIPGWRRSKNDRGEAAADKICLNHFVTPQNYRLSPPHSAYGKILYQKLLPIYGNEDAIQKFWNVNEDWRGTHESYETHLIMHNRKKRLRLLLEYLLSGSLGNLLEKKLKEIQTARIQKGIGEETNTQSKIIFTDNELRFHPHLK